MGRNKLEKHFDYKKENILYEKINKLAKNNNNEKFYIPCPPPNITGKLHLGHALGNTIQDFMIRYQNMKGFDTLFIPGTDHAGIATEEKILQELKNQNINNPSKEQFYSFADKWQSDYKEIIYNQMRKLGLAANWELDRYTLDHDYKNAAIAALKICHDKNMIYKQDNDYYLDMKYLANKLINEFNSGNLKIIPENKGKTLIHFLENIEPWCISRQINWGLQLPIYFNDETFTISDSLENAKLENAIQETDVLDTWFTSSLWPFAILGWPNKTKLMEDFYPASLIETGEDILFFWCARMLMMGLLLTDKLPFKTIYLHGIIRDKQGRKMSKSLGNGIDPLDIIEKYGCDALRYALLENNHLGNDIKISEEMFINAKKFTNKIWQISRFINNFENNQTEILYYPIIEKLNWLKENLQNSFDNFKFDEYCIELKKFFWDDFCNIWIEENKSKFYDNNLEIINIGYYLLNELLTLINPIMPFITYEIKQKGT